MQIKEKLESLGLAPEQLLSVTALLSDIMDKHERTVKDLKLDYGMQIAFRDNRVKDDKLIKALLDMEKIRFDEESGDIIGLAEQIKSIKETHAYLFEGRPVFKGLSPGVAKGDIGDIISKSPAWEDKGQMF